MTVVFWPTTVMNYWIQMMDAPLEQVTGRDTSRFLTPSGTHIAAVPDTAALDPGIATARVVIISGLRLLRDGLADALTRSAGISVVAAVCDAERARAAIREHEPGLVLIDIDLRDSLSLVRAISAATPAPRIVVFAVSDSEDALLPYIEAGIHGYVARDGSLDDVVVAVESALRGETIISPRLAARLFQRLAEQRRRRESGGGGASPSATDLTMREQQILSLVEQGLTNKEIARHLGIELATVKNHVHHVLEKLKVARRGQAAARARGEKYLRD